jgi:hypothetical protein
MAEEKTGLYLVALRVENPILLGSPRLTLQLAVNASTGQVTGRGDISQSVTPQEGAVHIPQVTGEIFHTGFGTDTMLVHLTGEYVYNFPPPAIGSMELPFSAALAVQRNWDGKGSFAYGRRQVTNCTVVNISENAEAAPIVAIPVTE